MTRLTGLLETIGLSDKIVNMIGTCIQAQEPHTDCGS